MVKRRVLLLWCLFVLLCLYPDKSSLAQNKENDMERVKDFAESYLDYWKGEEKKEINVSPSIMELRSKINQSFNEMQIRMKCRFDLIKRDTYIFEIKNISDDQWNVYMYEWVNLCYTSVEGSFQDYMGFGIRHIIKITDEKQQGLFVVADAFSDELMTGIVSEGYCEEEFKCYEDYNSQILVFKNQCINVYNEKNEMTTDIQRLFSTSTGYNVTMAIEYAQQWCGISSSQLSNASPLNGYWIGGQNSTLYNPAYQTQPKDCANFVSQCLVAGGLSTESAWMPYNSAWNTARGLANYLIGSFQTVSATDETTYPGNPVYWINPSGSSSTGHQMICTGKNTASQAVVSGHNPDLYRVTIENFSDKVLMTVLIVDSYHHTNNGYEYDNQNHWKFCSQCMQLENEQNHNLTGYVKYGSGHCRMCTVCAYKGTILSHSWVNNGNKKTCRFCGYSTNIN